MPNSSIKQSSNDEAAIIKKYKVLIDKLIPLQHENRLLEGLNKFSAKLPPRVRNIVKEEVIRVTSLTDAVADNSEFAKFPILKFKHFGIPMRLDKVGQQILARETSRFDDRYTVGVFESVMNSEHYQSHIKKEQQQKIVKAFKVESQTFKDIDFATDLAIRPNFTVYSPEFENGKHCPLSALSQQGMVIQTKRQPVIEAESLSTKILVFTFPKVAGLNDGVMDVKFELQASHFNKDLLVTETHFKFADDTPKLLIEQWIQYIKSAANHFPLERELEIERVLQNLERDRIFANSPWIPVFLGSNNGQLAPLFELSTPQNKEYNKYFSVTQDLPTKQIFQSLLKELLLHKETFLLSGNIKAKSEDVNVAVTHRQLAKTGLMKQFIELATQSEQLRVVQLRLQTIKEDHKNTAFEIHDMTASDYPNLTNISHLLFCKDVTDWVGNLKIGEPEPFKPFPKVIIKDKSKWPIQLVMESNSDRRLEPRYSMNSSAKIKTGLFSQVEATLNDLSAKGLSLTVSEPTQLQLDDTVKISIKDLKLHSHKYEVVYFDKTKGILRLKLPKELVKSDSKKLKQLFYSNTKYFKPRDMSIKQSNIYRFLWELSIRNQACASILITNNRFTIDRLKTIYHKQDCNDLKPFSALGNEVPLHGFFADKNAQGPKSTILDKMLRNSLRDAHVVHIERSKDQRIIFVEEEEFLHGKVRNQISELITKKSAEAYVSHLIAIRCNEQNTPLTKKRLAEISKIDLDIYQKLQTMQQGYTHVMYLTNVSTFHNVLLRFGIYPEKQSPPE
ncbi:PilZ domain-containing protein [Paraglaciecola marina]|uniref:PilZ domain-containing protein n=1 Tax=Paraglaciecola marina TaxID=2500157 RepID=UPI00105F2DEF|nr:PilZ domain-containing protein [Paraglaciecola marina]